MGRLLDMDTWPYNDHFTMAEFAALPVAAQRQIALLVRALVEYLERHPEEAADLE